MAEKNFDKTGIEGLIPHRGRASKIDGLIFNDENPKIITAIKNVTEDDPDFDGHFPGDPTYPGVSQIECTNLAAASLIALTVPELSGLPLLIRVGVSNFKKEVRPGDTLKIVVKITNNVKNKFITFDGKINNQRDELVMNVEGSKGTEKKDKKEVSLCTMDAEQVASKG